MDEPAAGGGLPILDKFGKLVAEGMLLKSLARVMVIGDGETLSRITPASTINSFAEGSKFSRLEE